MVLLASAYMPPISFFAAILKGGGDVLLEQYDNYQKQTYRNRTLIATAGGVQALTLPIERGVEGKRLMRDTKISNHSDWRRVHSMALESAYMNSPFFQYYWDDIRPLLEREHKWLIDLNVAVMEALTDLLGIETKILLTDSYNGSSGENDYRALIDPAIKPKQFGIEIPPYYQVFIKKMGFIGNLSMVDLLFNMGPESRVVLRGRGQ